jgi:hypothetical protein
LDTSSLVERRRVYPSNHFIQLWQNIESLIAEGRSIAPEEVRVELAAKDDEVFAWAARQTGLFIPFDIAQRRETGLIANQFPSFVNNPKARNRADPFVIALARVRGAIVVTEERPGSSDSPKIPFSCAITSTSCKSASWTSFDGSSGDSKIMTTAVRHEVDPATESSPK